MPRITTIPSTNKSKSPGTEYVFVNRNSATVPGQYYDWNKDSGWGSQTNTALFATTSQTYNCMAAHPTGSYLFVGLAAASSTFFLQAVYVNRRGVLASASSTFTTTSVVGIDASPSGASVAIAFSGTPWTAVYPFTTVFGSAFANPATLTGSNNRAVKFSPTGASIFYGSATTPFIHGYPWSDTTGFGTKFSNPGTLPGGAVLAAQSMDTYQFPNGTLVVTMAHNVSPYTVTYQYTDAGGFGTKYTDPTALVAGSNRSSKFIYDGVNTYLAISHGVTPFIGAYPFSSSTGYGTKVSDPATAFSGIGYGLTSSSDGQTIFVKTSTNSPAAAAYKFAGGWGTKYADPATAFSSSTVDASLCYIKTP